MAEALRVPDWPAGAVAVLVTADVHAIPVSTAVRVDDRTVRFGLGRRRGSLERLRAHARCALVVVAENTAVTLYGCAREAGEAEGVVVVELAVDELSDHMTHDFEIRAGVDWRWTDEAAAARDAAVRRRLLGEEL